MSKPKNPLFGLNVRGTLGRALTFRKRGSSTIAGKTPIPEDIKSLAQLSWRHMYQKAAALWHLLSTEEKQDWESQARSRHMTGFAWFMSQCLKPNPGIYLPLQGGTMSGDIDVDDYTILNLKATASLIARITGASYDDVQDWLNIIQSSGRMSGGDIINNLDGSVTVEAGTGFIKTAATNIALTKSFDWAENPNVPLANNDTNYIYIDYNDGDPQVLATVDRTAIRTTDQFTIGRVYRSGTTLHILQSGIILYNLARLGHERLLAVRGFERASGGVISQADERYLVSTAGVFYLGHNKITTVGKNTFVDDKFTAWYYNGAAWVPVPDQTQIDKLQYNNIAAGLAPLSANRYGVHWIYIDYDSHLHSVYGQGDYKLSAVEAATVPASIPTILSTFAKLAAKVIVKQNADTLTSVVSAYEILFPVSSPSEHNDLGAIQGGLADDYYHLTNAQHTKAADFDASAVAAVEAAGLALASGKNIKLISALGVSHTWSGITAIMTAGTALALPNACYVGGDGKLELADADAAASMPIVCLACGVIAENATGEVLLLGVFRDDTWDWTPGGLIYASLTPGALTQDVSGYTTGDQVQVVGVAITADIILFRPSLELVEIS